MTEKNTEEKPNDQMDWSNEESEGESFSNEELYDESYIVEFARDIHTYCELSSSNILDLMDVDDLENFIIDVIHDE